MPKFKRPRRKRCPKCHDLYCGIYSNCPICNWSPPEVTPRCTCTNPLCWHDDPICHIPQDASPQEDGLCYECGITLMKARDSNA